MKKRPKGIKKAGFSNYWDRCQEIISTERKGTTGKPNERRQVAKGMARALKDIITKPRKAQQ